MCLPCIQVDEKKLKAMMSEVWSSLESPLVAIPVDYRLYARKKSLRSGYVLVTRGAVYVFKSKFMKPVVFDKKIHILDMRKITITKDNMMVIEFDDYNAEIKTKSITSLYAGIFTVLREVTFGVVEFRELPVESEIPLPRVEITERIPEAIRWRALFLAHFY